MRQGSVRDFKLGGGRNLNKIGDIEGGGGGSGVLLTQKINKKKPML